MWVKSLDAGEVVCRIKNHSVGTLLLNISEGMDLEDDVRKYEVIVAPTNYKRSKAIFTQKMIDDAKKTIQKLGYMESLHRRYANINDISVRNILFVNKSEAIGMKDFDLFDDMKKEVVSKPKKFDRVTEIGIEDFIANVLPTTNAMFVPVTTVMRSPNYWTVIYQRYIWYCC